MNEIILIARIVIDLGIVLLAYRLGKPWLYASIVVNLLLISLFGAKLEMFWGYQTNVGNVAYAGVFFAMYLLLEHEPVREAVRGIWIGVGSVLFFLGMMELTLSIQSPLESAALSDLMQQALGVVPRIAAASLIAFIVAQFVNTWLYMLWRENVEHPHWWLRIICVMMAAQLVDSTIFFFVAFWDSVAINTVLESLVVGYALKVAVGIIATPLVYLSHRIKATGPVRINDHVAVEM